MMRSIQLQGEAIFELQDGCSWTITSSFRSLTDDLVFNLDAPEPSVLELLAGKPGPQKEVIWVPRLRQIAHVSVHNVGGLLRGAVFYIDDQDCESVATFCAGLRTNRVEVRRA